MKIPIDYSAPHQLYQNRKCDPKQEVNRIQNDQKALGTINDLENNFQNQSDIRMLKDINNIKSPYLDDQTVSKAQTYTSTYPIIPANRTKYIIKEHYINVDSVDRDLEKYPNPNQFQVKFQPAADSVEKKTIYDKNGNFIYEGEIRFVADDRGAFLNKRFDNIHSISLVCAIIPLFNRWICGNCPRQYNNAVLDINQTLDTNNFISLPNGPVTTNDTGVLTTILDEPYVVLKIDELESWSPYYGTNIVNNNAFAKLVYANDFGQLSSFVKFGTCDPHEKFIFGPHSLNSIDKMTLSLRLFNNLLVDFDQDKTFIGNISEGDPLRNCSKKSSRITICPPPECEPCQDLGHCLTPGDIIYVYRVKPSCENIIPLNKCITIDCVNFIQPKKGEGILDIIELVLVSKDGDCQNLLPLCLDDIFHKGDYIAITYWKTDIIQRADLFKRSLKYKM